MGSKGGSSTPPAPTINTGAQTAANQTAAQQTTTLDRPNQTTPNGSLSWTQDPTNPFKWTANTSLNPTQTGTLNATQGAQNTLATTAGQNLASQVNSATANPFNFNGPGLATGSTPGTFTDIGNPSDFTLPVHSIDTGNFDQQIQNAQNGVMQQFHAFNDPIFAQQNDHLESQLAAQGIPVGSDAYNNAKTQLATQQNQLTAANQGQAIALGQGEQNTLFGQGVTGANFANNAAGAQQQGQINAANVKNANAQATFNQGLQNAQLQNQANQLGFSEALTQHQLPLNDFTSFLNATQVAMPQFQAAPAGSVSDTPILSGQSAQFNQQLTGSNAAAQQQANTKAMLGGLGSAAITTAPYIWG